MPQWMIDKGYREFCSFDCFRQNIRTKIGRVRMNMKYSRWRQKVLLRDNYTCKECKLRDSRNEVHHIIPLAHLVANGMLKKYYDVNNGMTLCKPCHDKVEKLREKNEESLEKLKKKIRS